MNTKNYLDILALEQEDQGRYLARIAHAADKASVSVDMETIRMYIKADLPMPPRLLAIYARLAHTQHGWQNYKDTDYLLTT